MRAIDRLLQRWRIRRALPWIRPGDRLLDVGCFDRSLIERVEHDVHSAVGVDPALEPLDDGKVRLLRGTFPDGVALPAGRFDCLTCLAVLEHVPDPREFAAACERVLAPGGRVVLTVPHPWVDPILDVLVFLRVADGMDLEEHHGYDPRQTVPLFEEAGLRLRARRRFQLGLNQLFVFEKPA